MRLNLITIEQLKAFINCWRLTLQCHAAGIRSLEIAAALEAVAQEIRKEEAAKARGTDLN